jgi:hypothetical protein
MHICTLQGHPALLAAVALKDFFRDALSTTEEFIVTFEVIVAVAMNFDIFW